MFDTAMNLAPLLADAYPILLDTTVGTRDSHELEQALDSLPLGAPICRCFHFSVSVGAVFGVELTDGRRLAVKAHQPTMSYERLEAIHRAQGHLATFGVPCPRPVAPPAPFRLGFATVDEWLDEGQAVIDVTPARRQAMAGLLARVIDAGRSLLPLPPLDRHADRRPDVWPRPHNALFDFHASREGAEEIDAVGARAEPLMRGGPIVLCHQDWSVKQFRFRGDEVTAV